MEKNEQFNYCDDLIKAPQKKQKVVEELSLEKKTNWWK